MCIEMQMKLENTSHWQTRSSQRRSDIPFVSTASQVVTTVLLPTGMNTSQSKYRPCMRDVLSPRFAFNRCFPCMHTIPKLRVTILI
jgi:hypothetical protein